MEVDENNRLLYLESMGIQAWRLRLQPPGLGGAVDGDVAALSVVDRVPAISDLAVIDEKSGAEGSVVDTSFPRFLSMSIDAPDDEGAIRQPTDNIPPRDVIRTFMATHDGGKSAAKVIMGWDELQALVASCTACPLHQTRTQTVFGVGNRSADWMAIGEAPGEQEDLQGEPFVGRAGLLLNEMLRSIGLAREQVFIANILKCRPPKNRDPQVDEASACEGYLKQQLALVKPRIILAVGRIAAQNLLKTTTPIGKLRGLVHDYQGVPLVVTYHPAYLLRSPLEKRRAFDDLRLALHTYRKTI